MTSCSTEDEQKVMDEINFGYVFGPVLHWLPLNKEVRLQNFLSEVVEKQKEDGQVYSEELKQYIDKLSLCCETG